MSNLWYWTLPPGWYELARKPFAGLRHRRALRSCSANSRYRDNYLGRRCFIVGNGPSLQTQNLLLLKGETVFSVSSGYLHKDYGVYRPRFHCVPQITYTEKFTREVARDWFREMHERTGDAELFLSQHEEPLVRENNLFPGRVVSYLCMHGEFRANSTPSLDLTRVVPAVCSVPVMCLMIALYMGFKNIYLLGVEHDSFRTRKYTYFYEPTVLAGKTGSVTNDGTITDDVCDELYTYYRLFNQYRAINRIARGRGVGVYNATAGGALEEFERVSFESLFGS
jgi:hypothetical protein